MIKLLTDIYSDIKKARSADFLPTGIEPVDGFLDGGLIRKELVVIGGYTGSGKSFLSAQIFFNIASKGVKSAYFSLEISGVMIVSRLIGQISNLKATRLLYGKLNKDEVTARNKAMAQLAPWENFMHFSDDIYDIQVIEQAIKKHKYGFVVIDFIQNLKTGQRDEYSSMSYASIKLQQIAKENNCCILVVSQISNTANKTRAMEYKGSGGIAMVADLGFFLINTENEFVLQLRKNRRGVSNVHWPLHFQIPGGKIT